MTKYQYKSLTEWGNKKYTQMHGGTKYHIKFV